MRKLFTLAFVFIGLISSAYIPQYFHQKNTTEIHFNAHKPLFEGNIQGIESWLPEVFSNSTFTLTKSNQSLTGLHFRFTQTIENKEIVGAFINIHTDENNRIFLIQHRLCDQSLRLIQTPSDFEAYFVIDGSLVPSMKSYDLAANVLEYRHAESQRLLFSSAAKQSFKDTTLKAPVFLSNPILSAQQDYGTPYIDNNDSTNEALDDELFWVELPAQFLNDTLFLHDTLFLFSELYLPADPIPHATSNDSIESDRSKTSFEYVNALYHLIENRKYLHQIGYPHLVEDTVYIDPRSSFLDNSYFSVGNDSIRRFEYGLGGIDDAEDGDVVIHEMGHYITEQAAGWIPLLSNETAGMNEGNCDFFSKTYALTLSNFQRDKLYTWDGNFGSWQGVSMNTENDYTNLSNSLLKDREIWSKPLMCIYNSLGKATTDSLFLEHLFYYNSGATMPQMAAHLMKADSMLFDGKHRFTIRKCMCEQKILSPSECIVGDEDLVEDPIPSGIETINSVQFSLKTGNLKIRSDETILSYSLIDTQGRVVQSRIPLNKETQVSSSTLGSGMYVLTVQTTNRLQSFKLVVF